MHKPLRVLYGIMGSVMCVYGIGVMLAGEISAAGSRARGAGWSVQGDAAVFAGAVLAAVGAYIVYLAITAKQKNKQV